MFPSLAVLLFCSAATLAAPDLIHNSYGRVNNPEDNMTTIGIIQHRGYPAEAHSVTTEDGYIIEMHRIPYGKKSPPSPHKPAVFLMHGLICSSADWIVSPNGLGYYLADAGYDVWLGNVRGNTYGRHHLSLDPDNDAKFWKFSYDDHGRKDVPAQLKYIMQFNQQDTLSYVGHSQGTMNFWVAMESNPDLNEKIDAMFALGPVAQIKNMKSFIKRAIPYATAIKLALELKGIREMLPSDNNIQVLSEQFCSDGAPTQTLCVDFLFEIAGFDLAGFNETLMPLLFSHTPAGTSLQNLDHFAQGFNKGRFARYDYGIIGNMQHYKQRTPPSYNMAAITAPVVLMWGEQDFLADPTDVKWLATQLPNLQDNIRIADDQFNHLDFIWGIKADTLCYNIIVEKLNEATQKK